MGLIEDINICFKILLIFKYFPWNLFTCLKSLKCFRTSFGVSSWMSCNFVKRKIAKKWLFCKYNFILCTCFLMCISWQTTILTKVSLIIICWHLILNCKRIGTSNKHCLKHPSIKWCFWKTAIERQRIGVGFIFCFCYFTWSQWIELKKIRELKSSWVEIIQRSQYLA